MRVIVTTGVLMLGATFLQAQSRPRLGVTLGMHVFQKACCIDETAVGVASGSIALPLAGGIAADLLFRFTPGDVWVATLGIARIGQDNGGFQARLGFGPFQPYVEDCDVVDFEVMPASRSGRSSAADCPTVAGPRKWGVDFSLGYAIPLDPKFSVGLSVWYAAHPKGSDRITYQSVGAGLTFGWP